MIEDIVFSSPDLNNYIIVTYHIQSTTNVYDAAWAIAIGQSIGNPTIRSELETIELIEKHVARILSSKEDLINVANGNVRIAFPIENIDFDTDGITHLMCMIMGGQLDISNILKCHLIDIEFPESTKSFFKGPKFGFSGIRKFTKIEKMPLLGGIIKPKIGLNIDDLKSVVGKMIEGGINFIKEDEIISNPKYLPLETRVPEISKLIEGTNVLYSYCINSDPTTLKDKLFKVHDLGGNGVHLNIWSGLGSYNFIRNFDLPLFIHFQKSGDRIFTNKNHDYHISWNVICKLISMIGVDSVHAGMIGGYSQDDELDVINSINILNKNDVVPALSCGMKPELIKPIVDKIGIDFMASSGGWIHGHSNGVVAGVKEMKSAISRVKLSKIKIFILTFNDPTHLNDGLESLLKSNFSNFQVEINIINNHTSFKLNPQYLDRINKVYNNTLQPDFSTGFTTRQWNQALVLGFQDLNNPDCDLVICAQDDTTYHPDWLTWTVDQHKNGLDFIALGVGDNVCSYTPQAVKTIGMWDERFSILHYSECDYFLRAAMYGKEKSSVNDTTHGSAYLWNTLPGSQDMITRPPYSDEKKLLQGERHGIHNYQHFYARRLFQSKWGLDPMHVRIGEHHNTIIRTPIILTPFTYPYFEKDIDNLSEKGYLSIDPL